ncbi:hypothetical protein A6A06_14540 [Streptomyces sp. CB02923]|uniref:condensation domain-containing protein n=1 Tax=Streptomyces sp. CB02923 TaxID=1718985 RepID=UPI00093C8C45|nr:condensation domain-containing protein [Streptomyces sp. CB02923]OKI02272.1 hypothetical protein A6A06_14540 [Streptomyces sp. CB02923]
MTGGGLLYPTQERLWRLEQRQPGRQDFLVAGLMRLSGDVDEAALQDAVETVVGRHESLRTGFRSTAEGPRRFVVDPPRGALGLFDVRRAASPYERALDIAEEHCRRPFDLTDPPLLRAALARYGDTERLLALAMHHIVTDGYSSGIALREIGALYRGRVTGRAAGLPSPAAQYGEFVDRQYAWFTGEEARKDLAYWLDDLRGHQPLRLSPSARSVPADGPCGDAYDLTLPQPLSERTRQFALEHGCTPYLVLLAVMYLLVHLYTGERDIALGSAMANRGRTEYEDMVGYLRNIVVLRETVHGDRPFTELLGGIRGHVLSAYDHQALPFDHVVRALGGDRGPDGDEDLYPDVLFCTDNSAAVRWDLPGVGVERIDRRGVISKRAMTVFLQERDPHLTLRFVHRPDVLGTDDVHALGEICQALLRRILTDPETPLNVLSGEAELPTWWRSRPVRQKGAPA